MQGVRLSPDILDALERWRGEHPELAGSKSGAISYALRDWLVGLGYLRAAADDPEMTN